MFDFSTVKEVEVTSKLIFSYLTETEIYSYYFPGNFSMGLHRSPFHRDVTPSFSVYTKNRTIRWKDYSKGIGGNVFELVMFIKHCSYEESLQVIYDDLIKNKNVKYITKQDEVQNVQEIKPKIISVEAVEFEFQDILHFQNFNISKDILDMYHTGRANKLFLNGNLHWEYKDHNPCYYYYYPHSAHYKGYKPLEINKRIKWISNTNNDEDIEGYYQCNIKNRNIETLILTKARKDVMFYRSFDIDAMAIQGEGHHFNPDFIRHIKKYCKRIYSQYDNDAAGLRASLNLWRNHQIPPIIIPRRWGNKDATDLWKYNKPKGYEFIKRIKNGYYT